MIDLHLHTYHSDGSLSPSSLVAMAKERGASVIAVTDHDGLSGIEEAMEAGKALGVKVLPGIEFSAEFPDWREPSSYFYMHLLGYGMDLKNTDLQEAVKDILEKRKERNEKLLFALRKKGYILEKEDFQVYPQQTYIGKPNFARGLLKRGYIQELKEAFKPGMFLEAPEIKAIHRVKIDVREAISLIEKAGGVAVLAHPLKISYKGKNQPGQAGFFETLESLLVRLKESGLRGMECYYSRHLPYETERLLALAEKLNLLVSVGSDFHGPEFDANLKIGTLAVKLDETHLKWVDQFFDNSMT